MHLTFLLELLLPHCLCCLQAGNPMFPWIGSAPVDEDPHRYVFLLVEQPNGFNVEEVYFQYANAFCPEELRARYED